METTDEKPVRSFVWIEENHNAFCAVSLKFAEQMLFVSRYTDTDVDSTAEDKHGYQRPPTETRYDEIANYFLKNDHRYLIPPIIVSVRLKKVPEINQFKDLLKAGDIAGLKKMKKNLLSIVDGQHRTGGLLKAAKKDQNFSSYIPCCLFFNLSYPQEAELFDTINLYQRKLPKSILETTKTTITDKGDATYAQQIRRIAFRLSQDDDSVWGPKNYGINMTGVRNPDRKVTYEGLRRSTQQMFPRVMLDGLRDEYGKDEPIALAKQFWKEVSITCHDAWNATGTREIENETEDEKIEVPKIYRIKDLVGVASLAKLGCKIIELHLFERNNSGKGDTLSKFVKKLKEVDWEKTPDGVDKNPWMEGQAGFAGQKELFNRLYQWVINGKKIGNFKPEQESK